MSCKDPSKCNCKCAPKKSYLFEVNDPNPADFKSKCCVSFKINFNKQCNRCPFKQIEDLEKRERAMCECLERPYGVYKYKQRDQELEIEYNACL
jgi:hypothetical protein